MADELCPRTGDVLVAYDKKLGRMVCNQCIYNEVEDTQAALEQLTFTSYVASELKEKLDAKFQGYKDSLTEMGKIAPKVISSTLEQTVSKFFDSVDT